MKKHKNRIAIIGSAVLGKLVQYHAENDSKLRVVGFYDDFTTGNNILGTISDVENDFRNKKFDYIFLAIGYKQMEKRGQLFNYFKGKIPFVNIIHSSAYVDPSCVLGEGIIIMPGCCLDYGVSIDDNVMLNTGVTIAHHSTIQKHCFVAPRVAVAGLVTIEESTFVGINSTIIDCITVGQESVIGGGTVVVNNLEEKSVVVGVPAKKLKHKRNIIVSMPLS